MNSFLEQFDREFAPRLGQRGATFRRVFECLEARGRDFYTIIETGVCHLATADGSPDQLSLHGHSTLLFDRFVNAHDGRVYSVDISALHCERAARWVSEKTHLFCHDSRAFLAGFVPPTPIDCLYLDSLDVDWSDPHRTALHHLQELCTVLPHLTEGCIVFVDDMVNGAGKAGYIVDVMRRLGATLLFDDYQIGWQLTSTPPPLRAWGHYDADELRFVLERSRPRRYRYVRPGLDERILTLQPDGRVGHGAAACEERWFAERDAEGRVGIVLAGGSRVTARLAPTESEDTFLGRWVIGERAEAALLPLPARGTEALAAGRYWLDAGSGGAWFLELLDSHDVGWCRRVGAQCWRVEHDADGRAWLHLSQAGHDTWRFTRGEDGLWRGAAEGEPPGSATLEFVAPVSEAERATRAALVAQRRFRLLRDDGAEWPIELLPDGAIGRGVTSSEAGWDVADEGEDGVSLLLQAREAVVTRLRSAEGGAFEGHSPLGEHPRVRVEPVTFTQGAYLLTVFTACLPRDRIRRIIEIGSGDGTDALQLQRYYDADVFAFECNPEVLPACERNLASHPRITLVPKAVGTLDGPVAFHRVINGNPYASSCFIANPEYPYERYVQEPTEVEMLRLDHWLDARHIDRVDLLALDVQGSCLDVLHGLGGHLEHVRFIAAELDTRAIYHGEPLAPEVIELLAARGFHLLRWINQWGVLPTGEMVDAPYFLPQYAGAESWFGDFLFVRRSPREAEVAAGLEGRRFRYVRLGHDERTLELLPNGQIGEGLGGCERNWVVYERQDGAVDLWIIGLDQVTCRLTAGTDGRWRGHWISHERMPVLLEPLPDEPALAATG